MDCYLELRTFSKRKCQSCVFGMPKKKTETFLSVQFKKFNATAKESSKHFECMEQDKDKKNEEEKEKNHRKTFKQRYRDRTIKIFFYTVTIE